MGTDDRRERLRALPSVDRLATAVARAELAERRAELLAGADDEPRPRRPRARAAASVACGACSTRPASSSTRTSAAHRSPPPRARRWRAPRTATPTSSSTSARGERGSRQDHVEELLRELTGAEAALAVNNCAAATLLACAALAQRPRARRLARAGDRDRRRRSGSPRSSRRPGARIVEVGTTNRTRLADYDAALAAGREHGRDPARPPVELPHASASSSRSRSRRSASSASR